MALRVRSDGARAAVEKCAWRRRLDEALRNGDEVAGKAAVDTALLELVTQRGIKGRRGTPPAPIPEGVLRAAKRWLKGATLGEMAQTAGMKPPSFLEWVQGPRWADVTSYAWNKRMELEEIAAELEIDITTLEGREAVKRERRQRRQK